MSQTRFTLAEAMAILPMVKKLVIDAQLRLAALRQIEPEIRGLSKNIASDAGTGSGGNYLEHLLLLEKTLAELRGIGCLVRSVEEGLVDFPHLKEGREVCLCWRLGETKIEFWHESDAGFAGRKPLREENQK